MTALYAQSTDGSDSDGGTTWALAKATLTGVAAIDAAGDTTYVSQVHAESTAGAVTLAFAGTPSNPSKVICGNNAAEPPTALATTATVTATGSNTITLTGCLYAYGIQFISGGAISFGSASAYTQRYENCAFRTTNSGSGGFISQLGGGATSEVVMRNCTLKFAGASNYINTTVRWRIVGGSVESGTSTPTTLFRFGTSGKSGNLEVDSFDFSNFASTLVLFDGTNLTCSTNATFRNCKMPASWSGSLYTGTLAGPGVRLSMYNCDSASTNYRLWIETYAGSIKSETTIVRTGGASDGTTGLSWKMASSANCSYPLIPLISDELATVWNDTTGSSVTITMHILHDSLTNLTDGEVWLEAQELGTSGSTLGVVTTDAKADVLATAANQTTSSETWTTTGLTNPNKQQLSVTFTPQNKGPILLKVVLAKASKTIYVCPEAVVT